MKTIRQKIEEKLDLPHLIEALTGRLSTSELSSLLLDLFQEKVAAIDAGELLRQFSQNRFVMPSTMENPLAYKELELTWLRQAEAGGFTPVVLSPLAPLGSCAVVAPVHQNNIISATRGTEVVADATNVLALLIAQQYKEHKSTQPVKYATTHRHVRGQSFDNPAFSAHFGVFCLVTGGMAQADFSFEISQLLEHLRLHLLVLSQEFSKNDLSVQLYIRKDNPAFQKRLMQALETAEIGVPTQVIPAFDKGDYYQQVQFKLFLSYKNFSIDLADGGLVDWTQKLIPNRKHRMFISGSGIEIVHKIRQGTL